MAVSKTSKPKYLVEGNTEENVTLLCEQLYKLKEENKELKGQIVELTRENSSLERTFNDHKQKIYESISEVVRLRRMMELVMEDDEKLRERISTLERRIRNLELWEKINGIRK